MLPATLVCLCLCNASVLQVRRLEDVGLTRGVVEGGLVSGWAKVGGRPLITSSFSFWSVPCKPSHMLYSCQKHADHLKRFPSAVLIESTGTVCLDDPELATPTWRGYGQPPVDSKMPKPPAGSLGSFKKGIQSIPLQVNRLQHNAITAATATP
jgi:hypothetical protein